jgi:glycosyltransferase involved in cell wall biosynthesis
MKIVNYIPTASFFVGGGERVPLEQTKYLKKLGVDISLMTLKTSKETDVFKTFKKENPDIPILYLEATHMIKGFANVELTHELTHEIYLSLTRQANAIISKNDFDVAITHYAPGAFSVPNNVHQVLFLHGVPKEYQKINDIALNHADQLVAVSNSVKQGWIDLFKYNGEIEVIHNGIDTEKFKITEEVELDIDILYVGRLIEIKGVRDLIKAIGITNKKQKDLIKSAHIVGTGPYREELEKLTKSLNLDSIVHFDGYVEDSDLLDFYRRSKVCVFPSYAKEGVLTTLLEASSFGKAVITSNCCGMTDLVRDGFNGLLFKPQDSKKLSEKLLMVLQDKNLQKKLGKKAREEIVKNWSWESAAGRLLNSIKNSYA